MLIPVKFPTDPADTEGLRSARWFDAAQGHEFLDFAREGLRIDYEDRGLLEIMAVFGEAILHNTSDVYLSKETEARLSRFLRDPRVFNQGIFNQGAA
jgi:hypothetical protein